MPVYLAEDHVAIRQLLRQCLELRPGYQVVGESANGAEIVRDCQRLKPAVLVLDLSLPSMGGLEILRQLKAAPVMPRVLVFSSHDEPADEHKRRLSLRRKKDDA